MDTDKRREISQEPAHEELSSNNRFHPHYNILWALGNIVLLGFSATTSADIWKLSTIPNVANLVSWVIAVTSSVLYLVQLWWEKYGSPMLAENVKSCKKAEDQVEQVATEAVSTVHNLSLGTSSLKSKNDILECIFGREELMSGRITGEKLAIEVANRTSELLGQHPLQTNLAIKMEANMVKNNKLGELLVLERITEWDALWTKPSLKLGDLFKPLFIFTSLADTFEGIQYLAAHGFIDLLWPIPYGWVQDANHGKEEKTYKIPEEVKEYKWLNLKSLSIPSHGETTAEQQENIKLYRPENFDDLKNFLRNNGVPDADLEEAFQGTTKEGDRAEIVKHCLGAYYLKNRGKSFGLSRLPESSDLFSIGVKQKDRYTVWVKKSTKEILYRYELPFRQPARVKRIEINLKGDALETWQLDPATVHCPFPLKDPSKGYDETNQVFEWKKDVVPFLPGYGLAFTWREKAKT